MSIRTSLLGLGLKIIPFTEKENPNHDERGRFAAGSGGGGSSSAGHFGEWGASLGDHDVLYGYRGESEGANFGNSEGDGVYLAKEPNTAAFFNSQGKTQTVKFSPPKNPMVVKDEPLHLLEESDVLTQPIKKSDSDWTKANKKAYALAMKKTGGEWDAEEVGHQLTKVLKAAGHDGVYVRSGGEEWVVLFDRNAVKK